MKTKTQEKIKEAKMYYSMVYVNDCYGSKDLLSYMRLKSELFDIGYEADEQDKKVIFRKFEIED